MVTKDYSKSRMRENRTYGSVRGGQSNLIPSTRLTAFQAEGGGIALTGDEHKVSVTGFTFSAIWHDKHSDHWFAALVTKGGNTFSRAKPDLLVFPRAKARL